MKKVAFNLLLLVFLLTSSLFTFASNSGATSWEIQGEDVYVVYPDGTKEKAQGDGVCRT